MDWQEMLSDAWTDIRLAWRLFKDKRVRFSHKLILIAGLAYVVFPFDIVVDMTPILGQIDDLTVFIVAVRWFIDSVPARVVIQHRRAMEIEERIRSGEEEVIIIDNDTEEASGVEDENTIDGDFTQL